MPDHRWGTSLFIDENLEDNKIGVLSIAWPPAPQQIIARIREQFSMYDEIKWSKIARQKVPFVTEVIEAFFSNNAFGRIHVAPIDTNVDDAVFDTLSFLRIHCAPYHAILMDDHTTPKGYMFERRLSEAFDCRCVLRLDSKATPLLQLCDLMLNLVIRAQAAELPKSQYKASLVQVFKAARDRAEFPRCFYLG